MDAMTLFKEGMLLVVLLSAPPMIVAVLVGVLTSLVQALMQIQDQTLPMAVKVIAVVLSLVLLGPMLASPLVRYTDRIFTDFPAITRGAIPADAGPP